MLKLKLKIEKIKLNYLVSKYGLKDIKTINQSKMIDILINKYYKSMK